MVRKYESESRMRIERRSVDAVNTSSVAPLESKELIKSRSFMGNVRSRFMAGALALLVSMSPVTSYAKTVSREPDRQGHVLRINATEYENILKEAEETRNKLNSYLTPEDLDLMDKRVSKSYNPDSISSISEYVLYSTQDFPEDIRHMTIRQLYKKWLLLLSKITVFTKRAEDMVSEMDTKSYEYKRLSDLIRRSREVLGTVGSDPLTKGLTFKILRGRSNHKTAVESSDTSKEAKPVKSTKAEEKKESDSAKSKKSVVRKRHKKVKRANTKEVKEFEKNCDYVEGKIGEVSDRIDKLEKNIGKDPFVRKSRRELSKLSGDLADVRRRGLHDIRISKDPKATLEKYNKKLYHIFERLANLNHAILEKLDDASKPKTSKADPSELDNAVKQAEELAGKLDLGAQLATPKDATAVETGDGTAQELVVVKTEDSTSSIGSNVRFDLESDVAGVFFNEDSSYMSMGRIGGNIILGNNISLGIGVVGSASKYYVPSAGDQFNSFSSVNGISHSLFGDLVDNSKPGTVLTILSIPYGSLSLNSNGVSYSGRLGASDDPRALYGGLTISTDQWMVSGDLIFSRIPGLSERMVNGKVKAAVDNENVKASVEYMWLRLPNISTDNGIYELPTLSGLNADIIVPIDNSVYLRGLSHAMWHQERYRVMAAAGLGVISNGILYWDVGPSLVVSDNSETLGFYSSLALKYKLVDLEAFVSLGDYGIDAVGFQANLPVF